MTDRSSPRDVLLASIADGSSVDWDSVMKESDPGEKAQVTALRDVSRIAAFSRSLQRGGEPFTSRDRVDHTWPERWGCLLLLEMIGAGSQAEVFRAWDTTLQREVALKLIKRRGRNGPDSGEESLLQEGRAAGRIRHPNVVTIHGIDRHDGRIGLWMELVRGDTLEQEVRSQGPLAIDRVFKLAAEIGSALAAVHGAGLLHRDLKPANIVRDAEDRYVLADFGLGRRAADGPLDSGPSGTPMYMAPELFGEGQASERSDIYSLGLLLWFALAGRHPFSANSLAGLITDVARGPAPIQTVRPDAPAALAALVGRSIAPGPAERFPTAKHFLAAVETARSSAAPVAPKRRSMVWTWLLAAMGVLAAVSIALFLNSRSGGRSPEVTHPAEPPPPAHEVAAAPTYAVAATFLKRDEGEATRLLSGDRVKPGDPLSLEVHATLPAWVYVLNEDDRGERYLLFPQPRFDAKNPLPADSTIVLPGTIGGRENAWTVTSAGGREYFLVVVSPEPIAELEAELGRLPAAEPGRPIEYAPVGNEAIQRLRGVGGVSQLPPEAARPTPRPVAFDKFRALAGRETGVKGVWVRQFVLENPAHRR